MVRPCMDEAKTAEVDMLLSRIANALEADSIPSVEDAVKLEKLYWDYLEFEDSKGSKVATTLGLRDGNNIRNPKKFNGEKLDQDFINSLVGKKKPAQSTEVIRAYINKEISVYRLFGERVRKNRNDIPWQLRMFRGELVQRCLDRSEKLNCNHFGEYETNYVTNNVFSLLEDLTNIKLSIEDVLARHPATDTKQLEKIKRWINEEVDMLTDKRSKLISRSVFIEDYKFYKKVCDNNNPKHQLKKR